MNEEPTVGYSRRKMMSTNLDQTLGGVAETLFATLY